MYAISGCDTTYSYDALDALANIGISDELSADVVKGCEKFICKLFSAEFSDADKL